MNSHLALIVEDDFDASIIFAKALEAIGFDTEIIVSGDQAVERLNEVVPGVIVLDLHLPIVGGVSILRDIRNDERLAGIKVIVTTADTALAELSEPMADLVLLKPTTYTEMRKFAENLML